MWLEDVEMKRDNTATRSRCVVHGHMVSTLCGPLCLLPVLSQLGLTEGAGVNLSLLKGERRSYQAWDLCVHVCACVCCDTVTPAGLWNPFKPFVLRVTVRGPLSNVLSWSLNGWAWSFSPGWGWESPHEGTFARVKRAIPQGGRWSDCREGTGQGSGRHTLWTRAPWPGAWTHFLNPLQLWNLLMLQFLLSPCSLPHGELGRWAGPQEMPHLAKATACDCNLGFMWSSLCHSDPLGHNQFSLFLFSS